MPNDTTSIIKRLMQDPLVFADDLSRLPLRTYQEAVARQVVQSILSGDGLTFVVMFPRQSGKNELQAQLEAWLLILFSGTTPGVEIVKVSPTWKPQSLNAMRRLERVLQNNVLANTKGWRKESGYIFKVGNSRISFLSGDPESHIVGATANLLLEVDEAQDVSIAKYDKDIAPMAASTNATRIFWGTAWTSNTLLARELRAAMKATEQDGITRVFRTDADKVGAEVPAYKAHVDGIVARMGRNHPMVKTQYFSEELDAEGALFTAERIRLMQGTHPGLRMGPGADAGWGDNHLVAFLVDVAGQDEAVVEGAADKHPGAARDSTAITIVEVDTSTIEDPGIGAPVYRVLDRHLWTGLPQSDQYGRLRSLVELWNPRHVVIDATGIGAGLSSFLERTFPNRIIPFVFTAASKARLCWNYLSIIDGARWKEPTGTFPSIFAPQNGGDRGGVSLGELFIRQLQAVTYEVLPGPGKLIRWEVPAGTRDPLNGEYLHDDLVMSAALVAELDALPWGSTARDVLLVRNPDPLTEMDKGF